VHELWLHKPPISANGQAMETSTKNSPMNYEITLILWTNKNHASSNFERELTWATPENNSSLACKDTPPLHVLSATHMNRTHGSTYYTHVDNNIYTHFTLKDTTKQYGK
jgi:hypothetical protein